MRDFFYAVGLFVFLCSAAGAQSNEGSAIIAGTVLDQTGKAIQNASVAVKNESSGLVRKVTSGADGRFAAASLPSGVYTIEASAPGFATAHHAAVRLAETGSEDVPISLEVANASTAVTVEGEASVAAQLAPIGGSLEDHSARSVITPQFVANFMSPVGDFTDVTQMAPGTFSVSPNGVGLGDSKTFFRGFSDGQYTMTFDGIPFEDTNSPTHHSWAFFPGQWIGATDFDRSPGSASTIGPTNFGGSINLMSRDIRQDQNVRATVGYGSFGTLLLDLGFDSGQFGKGGKSSFTIDLQQMKSDGYQTYNYQKRDAGSLKYQYKFSDRTTVTVFGGIIDLWTNTPNTKGPTRAQVAQFGDNFLLSGDPNSPFFYGLNFYHVQSDFAYIGFKSDLGNGWRFDNKAYMYRYWNKQNYNNSTTAITATSGVDKLNGYTKAGDILTLSHESRLGVLRTGAWYEWAYTDRYQILSNPRTWVNSTPNFHERFITQSVQPFAEYELRVTRRLSLTAGIKSAYYNMALNQFADNGKTVGNLGGVAFVSHRAGYNSWLPSVAANYKLKSNWSAYAQFGTGSVIPPSSVFDVKNAAVLTTPKPTTVKTYQVGSMWKINRLVLDADAYYSRFQNAYTSYIDPVTTEAVYTRPGDSITKGVEVEGTFLIGGGVSLYFNGTAGNAKYVTSGLWVANAPKNTGTLGLTWQRRSWDVGFFDKRIGEMYNDNGTANQAVLIDPFHITNMFINYTLKDRSRFQETKIRLSINNVFDQHNIVGITPATTASNLASPGDVLTLLPGRSIMLSVTAGLSPRR